MALRSAYSEAEVLESQALAAGLPRRNEPPRRAAFLAQHTERPGHASMAATAAWLGNSTLQRPLDPQ